MTPKQNSYGVYSKKDDISRLKLQRSRSGNFDVLCPKQEKLFIQSMM